MSWPRRIFYALAAPVAAVVFSLLVSAIVLEVSGHSPIDAFKSMWQYTDSTDSVVSVINRAIPYYVSALAVAIGFKMGCSTSASTASTAWLQCSPRRPAPRCRSLPSCR